LVVVLYEGHQHQLGFWVGVDSSDTVIESARLGDTPVKRKACSTTFLQSDS
jgi:hypothetical protein